MKRRTYVLKDEKLNDLMDDIPFFFRSIVVEKALKYYFDNSDEGVLLVDFLKGPREEINKSKNIKKDISVKEENEPAENNNEPFVQDKSMTVKNILGNFK